MDFAGAFLAAIGGAPDVRLDLFAISPYHMNDFLFSRNDLVPKRSRSFDATKPKQRLF
jgi:hypothetical protein